MPLPIVAIVGPPNAGKSTFLNKVVGRVLAVTSDVPGTTRDRQYADTAWNDVDFTLVDTAGLGGPEAGELETNIAKQIDVALAQADAIIFVVDGKQPPSATSQAIIKKIRNAKKPLMLVVNKLDSPKTRETKLTEYLRLGVRPAFAVSSLTGLGLGDLLDAVSDVLKEKGFGKQEPEPTLDIKVAIVGKPNVGKSSLFNSILKEERVVVSNVPGTTRAAIDSQVKINGVDFTFIDTAGLKKKDYRQDQPDVFAGFQTFKAIRKSDVCFFVIDATAEITKQDQRIASEIFAMEKGCIIVANKIDLYNGDEEKLRDYISDHFPFLWMCPCIFVSALTRRGLDEALGALEPIFDRRNKKIDNQTLTEFLTKVLKKNPPKLLRDQKNPKVFALHQLDVNPPKFELLVNHPAAISQQFRKFAENSIIRHLDFYGTPIIFRLKGKDKK